MVLGSVGGGIDGGQWQLPMPQMYSSGAITNGRKVPTHILAMLSSQGKGIVASNSVKKANLGLNTKGDGKFFKEFETKNKRKFRAAYTFPKAAIALIQGVIEAQRWLDQAGNKSEAAKILSSRQWYNLPEAVLERALRGGYQVGTTASPETNPLMGPLFWNSPRGVIS